MASPRAGCTTGELHPRPGDRVVERAGLELSEHVQHRSGGDRRARRTMGRADQRDPRSWVRLGIVKSERTADRAVADDREINFVRDVIHGSRTTLTLCGRAIKQDFCACCLPC